MKIYLVREEGTKFSAPGRGRDSVYSYCCYCCVYTPI